MEHASLLPRRATIPPPLAAAAERLATTSCEETAHAVLPLLGQALGASRALLIEESPDGSARVACAWADPARPSGGPAVSVLSAEVQAGGERWGALVLEQSDPALEWVGNVIASLEPLARMFGAAIQRDRESRTIRLAEERYRRIVELSPDGIVLSVAGRVAFANAAAGGLLGARHPEELIGRTILEFAHAGSRPEVLSGLQIEEGRPAGPVEERFVRLDGSAVDVEVEAIPFSQDGQTATQFVFRDVTDRRRAEEAARQELAERERAEEQLRAAEERYRTLVERIPAVTYTAAFGENGTWYYVSPHIEAILGFTQEEWMARDDMWHVTLHPEDREKALEAERRSRQSGEPLVCEYRLIARDGRTVWIRDEGVVVPAPDGAPVLQGVMFDISESKRAEEELARVVQREREAAERLRLLDEMKTTFLHAVSHELRTPLSSVLGFALTLERKDIDLAPDARADILGRIAANARKLDRLLSDLLDMDRLDRGIVEPSRRRTDVLELVRRTIEGSGLPGDRTVHLEGTSVVVAVDGPKVERIVENLMANAARHTPPGTAIWVRVEPRDEGVLMAVDDDGPGIPGELREDVFEPFRQGPDPPAHAPGVGIGLSLVARFAELHGGRAWVEDRPGGGASFRVFLPDYPFSTGAPTSDPYSVHEPS